MEDLKIKLNQEIQKLSKNRQDAINAVNWFSITDEIGKKFFLSPEEIENLQIETCLALVGLVNLNDYVSNIEGIGVTKDQSITIAKDIFEKIFSPIANSIEKEVKNNLDINNINWDQRINFILSGGDYSIFMRK